MRNTGILVFLFVAAVAAAITMIMILRPSTKTSMCARVCKPKCPPTKCDKPKCPPTKCDDDTPPCLPPCVASIDEALLILDSYVDGQRTFGMVDIAKLLQDTMPHELVHAGLHMSQWMVCGLLHIMYISDPTPLTARHYAVLLASILAQEDNITFKTDAFKQDFATEIDDMQPLVRKNIGSSFPYLHPRKMFDRWQQMAMETDTIGLLQTWQQLESTSHPVHLYQQHMKNQQQNGIQKFLDTENMKSVRF